MKKIRNLVLILALFLCFNGCEKNPVIEEPKQQNDQFTIEQAEAWFGAEWIGSISLKSGNIESEKIGIKPDWCDGFTSQNGEVEVVEVGLLVQGRFGFVDMTMYDDWKTKKDSPTITSLTRMVFLKYKKDKRIDQFLMTIVGNKEYHAKKVGRLADNTYLSREKHFSGYVFFHDLKGNFVNGWSYINGKIVGKCSQKGAGNFPLILKTADCTLVDVIFYNQFCTDWYVNGRYSYTSCEGRTAENEYFYLYCAFDPDSGDGGYGGGGGSEPCNCQTICPVCGKCLEILKSGSLGSTCRMCAGGHPAPIVDATNLLSNAKADCIYQKLLSGGTLSNFISRYFGVSQPNQSYLGELNLTWKLDAISNNGITVPIGYIGNSSFNTVEIILNSTTMDARSSTEVAMTMLHEALHAKLIGEYYDSVGSTDFNRLFAYYKGWGTGDLNTNQQMEMLNLYAGDMATALQSFDQSRGINQPISVYNEALKYQLSIDIYGHSLYPTGESSYNILHSSTKNCN